MRIISCRHRKMWHICVSLLEPNHTDETISWNNELKIYYFHFKAHRTNQCDGGWVVKYAVSHMATLTPPELILFANPIYFFILNTVALPSTKIDTYIWFGCIFTSEMNNHENHNNNNIRWNFFHFWSVQRYYCWTHNCNNAWLCVISARPQLKDLIPMC